MTIHALLSFPECEILARDELGPDVITWVVLGFGEKLNKDFTMKDTMHC